jgi:hypothetical protein
MWWRRMVSLQSTTHLWERSSSIDKNWNWDFRI